MRTVIRGATVVALDDEHGTAPFQGDILIEDDRIVAVGDGLDAPDARELDGRNRLAIPGLVNAHFHSNQNFLRGRYPGRPLELLMLYAYPFDPALALDPELVYLRTLLVGMEALKTGVTSLLDDCIELPTQDLAQLDAVFRAYEDVGIRASCSGHVIDKFFPDTLPYAREVFPEAMLDEFAAAPVPTVDGFLEFSEEAVRRFHGRAGRLQYVVAPSGPQRCTDELLVAAAEFADRHRTPYHIHVLETKVQLVTGRELYGKTLVQHLSDVGALRRRVTLAHAIWIDDDDIELIAEAGSSVAHNPICNLRIGSGIAPLRKLLDRGVNVGLGTDEIDCNDSGRIFDVMHMAGLIHTVTTTDYERWPTPAEILTAATRGGARSVCLEDEIGSLEPGRKADIVLLDLDSLLYTPLNDPATHLVYAENGSSVDCVLVAGEVVVEDGRLTRVDEAAVLAEIRGRMGDYLDRRSDWEEKARRFEPYMRKLYDRCVAEDAPIDRLATGAARHAVR